MHWYQCVYLGIATQNTMVQWYVANKVPLAIYVFAYYKCMYINGYVTLSHLRSKGNAIA